MSTESNEIQIKDRDTLTSEEREKVINDISAYQESSEKPNVKITEKEAVETPKPEDTGHEQVYELEYHKPGETPKKEVKKEEPVIEKGTPDPKQKLYDDVVTMIPELKGKYKNYDELIAGQPKIEEPKPADTPPTSIVNDKDKKQIIVDRTYELVSGDPSVKKLLKLAELDEIPTTIEGWRDLFKKDQYVHDQILKVYNSYKTGVTKEVETVITTMSERDKLNEEASSNFATRVGELVTAINPNINEQDSKTVADKMKEFFNKHWNDANYYIQKNGIPILSEDLLLAGFQKENQAVLGIAAASNKGNGGGKKVDLKEEARRQQKESGLSMNTLGAAGANTGDVKTYDFSKEGTRDVMSSNERLSILEDLEHKGKE